MTTISMITVTYNAEDFLPSTLKSVEALFHCMSEYDRSDFEYLVIDGGSRDSTLSLLANSGLPCRVISEPDRGIYDAMNKGAALSSGRWVQFLNAGDVIQDPAGYVDLYHTLQALPTPTDELWAISGAIHMGAGVHNARTIGNIPHSWVGHLAGLQSHCHQACWFRRDALGAFGGYRLDVGTAADYASIVQFGFVRPPMVFDRPIIGYLGGGVSDSSQREVQHLLHKTRRRVLRLNGVGRVLSSLLAVAVYSVNSFRILLGRSRRKLVRGRA
ncbi:hypothetical protein J2W20_000491 [Sinomonas atrocyanea]|uniref:glycosyltransferase n=1 Tax=Sinomonas atrocyanea TaxID=37927 RepID=UPI00278045FD|nr:glycosyltransferase [Sinomonas atrocyanea]MDQ0258616.1 hypothetical protein [Sinomonas atrocyanea]